MPRGRPKSKNSCKGRPTLRTIDRKPIRPLERQRMRPWLTDLLDYDTCHQLSWISKKEQTFRVSWKHAAGQTFNPEADVTLFELWARHTGKYYTGDLPDPKRWKANFRCALHSVPDVEEDKSLGVRRGNNAFRVYKLLDQKRIRKPTIKRGKEEKSSDDDTDYEEFDVLHNIGTKSRPRALKMEQDEFDSDGSESGYSPSYESNHSDWALTTENLRRQDHETEAEKSPLPNFEELYQSFPKTFSTSRLQKKHGRVPVIHTLQRIETMDTMDIQVTQNHDTYIETDQSTGELVLCFDLDPEVGADAVEFDPEVGSDAEEFDPEVGVDAEYMAGFWNSIIDTNLDIQEEIVISGGVTDGEVNGPSVIVMKEKSDSYNYEYTSLTECTEQVSNAP